MNRYWNWNWRRAVLSADAGFLVWVVSLFDWIVYLSSMGQERLNVGYFLIDIEQDRPTTWIKEAVHIRNEGHRAMNRDQGSHQLSHAYDRFLDATTDRRINTRKNWVSAFSDEDLVMRSKRQDDLWIWLISIYQPTESISRNSHQHSDM